MSKHAAINRFGRSANPAFTKNFTSSFDSIPIIERMTLDGAVNKTGILLGLCFAGAFVGWNIPVLAIPSAIIGLILALVTIFRSPSKAGSTTPLYALVQGIFLGGISFVESSFFPIPPDIMIAPMAIAKKNEFIKIFLIATVFSVLGGIFGYFIGAYFFEIAMTIIEFYNYENNVADIKNALSQGDGFYTWLAILFLAGFTPLPYKVFTITSGLISFNLLIFILISLISRGLRFFIVSYLSSKFGDTFTNYMNKHGQKWFTMIGLIIVIIAVIFYLLRKSYG